MKVNEKYYPIDLNTAQIVQGKVAQLARTYVPEWLFNEKNPDVGTTIAMVFADMMNDSAHKTNMLLYKYRIELMNMLGMSPRAAVPARSVVVFSLLKSAPSGVFVERGTQLLAYPEEKDKLVFETNYGIYLTRANVSEIYSISDEVGKILPIHLASQHDADEAQRAKIEFNMFDFSVPGIQKNLLMFKNEDILKNYGNSDIYLSFADVKIDDQPLEGAFLDLDKYEWGFLLDNEVFKPFDEIKEAKDDQILIAGIGSNGGDKPDDLTVCLRKKDCGKQQKVSIAGLQIYAGLAKTDAEVVYVGDVQQDARNFMPFTENITEYRACFIGSSAVFSKKGAEVNLHFNLNFEESQFGHERGEDVNFKHLMRKPKVSQGEVFEVKAQRVVFEYYNGLGWRKLEVQESKMDLFNGETQGEISIDFIMPDDIEKSLVNAFESYWIRISVVRADNSFRTPSIHTYPIVSGLTLSYKHLQGVQPSFVGNITGVEANDLTLPLHDGQETIIFDKLYDERDCVFIAFDAPLESGPISVYFDIDVDALAYDENNIGFEYSSSQTTLAFKELKVIDKTEKFKHSGCIIFNPPTDFSKIKLFNAERYWLKIVNLNPHEVFGASRSIKINDIKLNAAEVSNIQTLEEELFYVDRIDENMEFALSSTNILNAQVFVNEVGTLPLPEKENLLATKKEDVIAQSDMLGSYVNFFVRWQEVDNFMRSGPKDRHYVIDRQNGKIVFGDSKHGMIPQSQPRAAIRVLATTCAGEAGNVSVGLISRPSAYIKFLSGMGNIIPAYAGYNIESIDNVLQRGAQMLSNRGRLISKSDFEGAVRHFSDAIDKVRCEVSLDKNENKDEDKITIAVLMKEFYKSNEVFISLRDKIKTALLSKCDVSIRKGDLELVEPLFIKLSADVWVTTLNIEQAFEIQNTVKMRLTEFLHPVTGNFDKTGWQIGRLPKKAQIYSFLKTLNLNYTIDKLVLTGFVAGTDRYGIDYENAKLPVFSAVVSGEHNVHVSI